MRTLLLFVGTVIFWLGWPFWYVYFRIWSKRSRVVVICEDEVLLVKGWLGSGNWGLPGGGAGKKESIKTSAVRELREEVGISLAESSLREVGMYRHQHQALLFDAYFFVVELPDKPDLHIRWYEIAEAKWFKLNDIRGRMLDQDTAYALKQYMPINQIELL